ncbi:uncharacterized acetyltransferase At3g50280-like [Nymphaea colorata]|uniref:Acetyltransferase n=1 Tax=Nymphaea colorata TaxID=210225 RepID=A0A5K1EFK9_9MAGN|nr:uncharacterized acetyltransferase At3g50280-like [Nymphaea colorata]
MAITAFPDSSSIVTLLSESTVFPERPTRPSLSKLTASDLPMLSVNYIQKGVLFPTCPAVSGDALLQLIKAALSRTLVYFPMLAGRLRTDSSGFVYVDCDDSGVPFVHAAAPSVMLGHVLAPNDVPVFVRQFFALNDAVSYDGHFMPLAAVQVSVLADGVFIAATVNHAVADGTSFWNFFNTWAEIARGSNEVSRPPETHRFFVKDSAAVLRVRFEGSRNAPGKILTPPTAPVRERIFRFSRQAVLDLKELANKGKLFNREMMEVEVMGKESNDVWKKAKSCNGQRATSAASWPRRVSPTAEVSSFQSLCAQIWRSVTRARRLPSTKRTTFRMAANCRHRLNPPLHPEYFGNAIQSIATAAEVGDLLKREIGWAAGMLHRGVVEHGDATIRGMVDEWEKAPRAFPLGNADGASITMGSSARFPMYNNDFGWGPPVAVRSGRANKFDGKMSAFPGRDGSGSVDVEMCLAPDTMALLERDPEFMRYVTAAP